MPSPSLAIQGVAVVVRGRFNPAIVSPGWLLAQGLLGVNEALDVRSQAILSQFSQFRVAWLTCQVTEDLLTVSTDEPVEFEKLRDVARGVLSVLNHTPISALGINRMFHFQIPSWDEWHGIGDDLVPKSFWEKILRLPGTQTVAIQGVRQDRYGGSVNVTVQPSTQLKAGIFVAYNDHYVLQEVEVQPHSRAEFAELAQPAVEPSPERIPIAVRILSEDWETAVDGAERAAFAIANLRRS